MQETMRGGEVKVEGKEIGSRVRGWVDARKENRGRKERKEGRK